MPSIYAEFIIGEGDSLEVMRQKLYLGEISAGEQAYTLGAGIGECRKSIVELEKQLAKLDELVNVLREGFRRFKSLMMPDRRRLLDHLRYRSH